MRILQGVFSLFLLVTALSGKAQTSLEQAFAKLQKGSELPEDLQATRSAVFLKISSVDSIGKPLEWKLVADILHQSLVDMQIDAVAYYRWQDLNAGFDATGSYVQSLRDREINQVVLLSIDHGSYQIYIIPTSEDPGLLAAGSRVWHTSSNSLEGALESLTSTVRRTGLDIANFLIAESPEFFVDTEIFEKNRFESFQPDLKLDKLAAPLFFGKDSEDLEHSEDMELGSIMRGQYPFNYELVSADLSEDLMKKAGFQYVLRYLHAEEFTLKTLLDYPEPTAASSKPAFKFYIKHLITGDIYLGNTWDSKASWQAALNLHLSNMRKSLKVE